MMAAVDQRRRSHSARTPRASRSVKIPPTASVSSSDLAARTSRASRPSPAPRSTSRTTAPCTSTPPSKEGLERAMAMIERMFQEIEVGKVYTGRSSAPPHFGAFMELLPGKDGLIHVSELADCRVEQRRRRRQERRHRHRQVHRRRRKGPREDVPPRLAPRPSRR